MTTAKPTPSFDHDSPFEPAAGRAGPARAVRIGPDRLLDAARALVPDTGSSRAASAQRFLSAARGHGLDLDNTWGVLDEHGRVRHAALATPGSGRTHMLFTSPARTETEAEALAAAIDAACRAARGKGLAQALLEPDDGTQASAFLHAGFQRLATLGYLRRRNPRVKSNDTAAPSLPEGVTLETWASGMDGAYITALDRSYVDTLDCPELCGLRTTSDVLESHKAAGDFEPDLWWLVRLHGEPQGAMLFSPGHGGGHVELVYLGLAPPLRGTGLGATLLDFGLRVLAGRPEPLVTCAVDQRNEPARRLYRRAGFEQFAERAAFIRPL